MKKNIILLVTLLVFALGANSQNYPIDYYEGDVSCKYVDEDFALLDFNSTHKSYTVKNEGFVKGKMYSVILAPFKDPEGKVTAKVVFFTLSTSQTVLDKREAFNILSKKKAVIVRSL